MQFLEIQFPPDISYGAVVGPSWSNENATNKGGFTFTNENWSQDLSEYDVAHGLRNEADFQALRAFFNIVRGDSRAFRFKDWSDYYADTGEGVFVQLTSTTFQMYKRESVSGNNYDKKIVKPVNGTIIVTGGSGATVSNTTGIVTVSSGTPTAWVGQYDKPAKFMTNKMRATLAQYNGYEWGQIPVSEVRL
jgi:uncharacterized protein (TIGR02217 family)